MSPNKHVVPAILATAITRSIIVFAAIISCNQTALAQQTLDFYDDGSDVIRINQLSGALEIVSPIGTPNSGAAGADVNAMLINPGRYQVGVSANADASIIDFYANGGAANPWAAGILAASFGAEGVNQGALRHPNLNDGGDGGTVTIDNTGFSNASATQITLSGYGTPELTGQLTLAGVYALSQGGQNSLALDKTGINEGRYSDSGDGGQVNVDFLGLIRDEGSFNSSADPLIYNAIGISAISRGGVFECWDYDCTGHNYDNGTYNKPGVGGDVKVTLHSGSDITLDSGSAIGIYAASMNGAILGTDSGAPFNVNTSEQSAGIVTVTVQEGANIAVGGGSALEAYGVFGLSAGSELKVPLQYQTDAKSLVNLGGAAFGSDVTVDHAGTVSATGLLAIGVAGMNVGGQAAVGLLGIDQAGVYEPNKNRARYQLTPQVLGDVSVSNSGTINVNGETSFGLLAVSLGRGYVFHSPSDFLTTDLLDPEGDFDDDGIINALDENDDNDELMDWEDSDNNNNGIPDYPCTPSATEGDFPDCDGVESGLVLGNTDSSTSTSAGDVHATNSGSITAGTLDETTDFGYGLLALSVGGGGAAGSGGLGILAGDNGGAGGHGGAVTVINSGDITTYGNHSQALLASSIGGGGGVGGSNTMPFVAVGGEAGEGGHGAAVDITLDGNGTLYTRGDLSDAVLAQSVGGGGGVGGSGDAWGLWGTLSVGGKGGEGGDGGNVSISTNHNDDPMTGPIQGSIDQSDSALAGFDIITLGSHSTGLMAQSIGGGGGTSGSARSSGLNVWGGLTMSIGRNGPGGGHGGDVDVRSNLDIYVEGDNARGISAQSIGGGGGKGGDAKGRQINIERASETLPNGFANVSVGGIGGDGGNSGAVEIATGGVIQTTGAYAIGVLAQSISGGGGDAGAATSWSKFADLPTKIPGWGIQLSTAIGRSGGDGGDASSVSIVNGFDGSGVESGNESRAGIIQTVGDYSAGLVAQSIGGGGGVGGTGHISSGKSFWYQVLQSLLALDSRVGKLEPFINIDVGTAVGGQGGAAGNAGRISIINGVKNGTTGQYQGGAVVTKGGNSHGVIAQSIGGGGGLASGGTLGSTGGKVNAGLALGGTGGAGGNGASVSVINPKGAVIRTGEVIVEASTSEEIADGFGTYTMLTRGGGSVGILAQSIGGGGGAGGGASAASTLPDAKKGDAKVLMAYMKNAIKGWKALIDKNPNKDKKPWFQDWDLNLNLSIAGLGEAGGLGGEVSVSNEGIIETVGELAHGIQAQSIGGGGGSGGSVEADPVNWQTLAAAPAEWRRVSLGITVGRAGGDGNDGGHVDVTNGASGRILTSGYGAHGIFSQSIGGGGGFGGVAAANSEGFAYLGYTHEGDGGAGGAGGSVSIASAGVIETVGDDANGILAQSIGGGGGSVAAGCTNSDVSWINFHVTSKGQSPCWGNFDSDDGLSANETTHSDESDSPESNRGAMLSMVFATGGQIGTSDHGMDGGTVDIEVSNLIATHGSRSMGVVAQSIGGGGSYVSQDATLFAETIVGAGAGVNHSHGEAINVNLSGNAAIETYGPGAWGILAQSIGGSGGFTGDSSLNLGLLASNTVDNVCCGKFTTGADGGAIGITLAENTRISTFGKNAHGIVAQSVGGGGGLAAGGKNDPNALVYMGNPRSREWNTQGLPEVTMTGQGGAINIDIYSGASVEVHGEGSIGILAQSSGNNSYMSPISIYIAGSVHAEGTTTNTLGNGRASYLANQAGDNQFLCNGCMDNAAILISGGGSVDNLHADSDFNKVVIAQGGSVSVADLSFSAIRSLYGRTDVEIYSGGTVTGGVVLGSSADDPEVGEFHQGGHWYAGSYNVFGNSSIHNYGVTSIQVPTTIVGSLKHYEGADLRFDLDPTTHRNEYALTISGLARLNGQITPVLKELIPGSMKLIQAGSLEGSPFILDPLLFDWHLSQSPDNGLTLSATADFQPAGIDLTHNTGATAQYLTRIWDSGEADFARHFAYMLALETEDQYSSMLTALSEPEVLQHDVAALRAMPAFMGDVIDCADASGAQVQGDKANCVWLQAGMSSGRYDGSDTERTDIDSTLFAIGMQREIQPGWYLGGAFGRNRSDIKAASFRGDGHTDMLAVGLRHEAGDWSMGASLAYGNGSFDSMRSFALPGIVGASAADNATMSSASGLDVIALQAQASYRFEWDNVYLLPELSLAVSNVERDAFEEESMVGDHTFLLQAASDSSTLYWVTPHVEVGGQWQVGEGTQLKAYVDAGVRVAPWDSEIDLRFAGVNEDTGWFRNRIDDPLSAAMLKAGVELFSQESLALKLEYGLEDNGDYRIQTGSARVDWNF